MKGGNTTYNREGKLSGGEIGTVRSQIVLAEDHDSSDRALAIMHVAPKPDDWLLCAWAEGHFGSPLSETDGDASAASSSQRYLPARASVRPSVCT